jgi:hypothetical protein
MPLGSAYHFNLKGFLFKIGMQDHVKSGFLMTPGAEMHPTAACFPPRDSGVNLRPADSCALSATNFQKRCLISEPLVPLSFRPKKQL